MKESVTYQLILDEGRAEGEAKGRAEGRIETEREILLLLGSKRLGEPDARTRDKIEKIADPVHLKDLVSRLLEVESWRDLLPL
jgi:predicted transposase YdaD